MNCNNAQVACVCYVQTHKLSEAGWIIEPAVLNLWSSLTNEERRHLLTFKESELHKQAVRQTRLYIEAVKGAALCCSVLSP